MNSVCAQKKALMDERIAKRAVQVAKVLTPPPPPEPAGDLVCWWCVHALPQLPCIHLPTRYDDKRDRFETKGNFCSWQCAKAWAHEQNSARSGEIQMFLMMMRRRAIGRYEPLWPAPKREALKIFGGTMTIEEFRSYGGLVEPPIIHWPDEKRHVPIVGGGTAVTETVDAPSAAPTKDKTRLKAIQNSTSSSDTLKLKRMKPLARAESTLENVLGITRKEKALVRETL
jgi:hypothetical protein